MTINVLLSKINEKLAGELLQYEDLEVHLDEVIDDINQKLNSKFPAFSEVLGATEYSYFPDRYMRSVVVPGVAYKFYTTDEEGIDTAYAYSAQYQEGLFLMLRDYLDKVPAEYQMDPIEGSYTVPGDMAYATGLGVH